MKKQKSFESGKIWLKKETRAYRVFVLFLTVLIAFSTFFSLAFAYMVRYLLNSASANNVNGLLIFACVLLGLLLIRILLKTLATFFSEKLRAKIVSELRIKFFSKILSSDYAAIQKYHSGDMLTRLTSDIQEIAVDTVGLFPSLVGMVVQCVGAIAALWTIDPIFTLVYVICGCVFGGITALFRKQVKQLHKDVLKADGEFRSFMQEGLSSIMTIKAYNAEGKSVEKAQGFANSYYTKRMKRNLLHSFMSGTFSLLSNFGLILAVVWCSISVLHGNNDYGSILSVILLLMQLQQPFASISSLIPAYYARIASGERLAEIDNIPIDATLSLGGASIVDYADIQTISFANLAFSYGRENIFFDLNYQFQKGKIICLTGVSGAGKSTIFKILLNIFKPSNGGIYLEAGNKHRQPLTEKERSLFAYVPQGHFLFSGTIYENLTFFSAETNEEKMQKKIKHALKVACAEFVWDFPDGLQTLLMEGGGGLSEGQLQRIAVARAILSERPILLLDEATSALDGETEQTMLENIRTIENKTCLIVTHRPAALKIADEIIAIENGQLVKIK